MDKTLKLNKQRKLFCEEYLVDLNGTQAAIRAGYSVKTAQEQSSRLLLNVIVSGYIKELMDARSKSTAITAEMVIQELAKIAFGNIQDLVKEGHTLEEIQKLKKEHAATIKSVKYKVSSGATNSEEISFEVYDKNAALEKLGKHLGMFEKDNGQKNTVIAAMPPIIYNGEEISLKEKDVIKTERPRVDTSNP